MSLVDSNGLETNTLLAASTPGVIPVDPIMVENAPTLPNGIVPENVQLEDGLLPNSAALPGPTHFDDSLFSDWNTPEPNRLDFSDPAMERFWSPSFNGDVGMDFSSMDAEMTSILLGVSGVELHISTLLPSISPSLPLIPASPSSPATEPRLLSAPVLQVTPIITASELLAPDLQVGITASDNHITSDTTELSNIRTNQVVLPSAAVHKATTPKVVALKKPRARKAAVESEGSRKSLRTVTAIGGDRMRLDQNGADGPPEKKA